MPPVKTPSWRKALAILVALFFLAFGYRVMASWFHLPIPDHSSTTASLKSLLIYAGCFYLPLFILQLLAGRLRFDILLIGIFSVAILGLLDILVAPLGLITFILIHAVWAWNVFISRARSRDEARASLTDDHDD